MPRYAIFTIMIVMMMFVMTGCERRTAIPTKQFQIGEVTFIVPEHYRTTPPSDSADPSSLLIEFTPVEIRDGRLSVDGQDYGPINDSEAVWFAPDGSFTVDGEKREPLGLSDNAFQSHGVRFILTGQTIALAESEEIGVFTVENSDGTVCKISGGAITIDEFTHGPYGKGAVVTIAPDGSIQFNP